MITKQVVNVSILQSAKVMAALYLVFALPYALLLQVSLGRVPWVSQHLMLFFAIVVAAFTALGFVFVVIGSWIYNFIAARVGGFEFTITEVGHD